MVGTKLRSGGVKNHVLREAFSHRPLVRKDTMPRLVGCGRNMSRSLTSQIVRVVVLGMLIPATAGRAQDLSSPVAGRSQAEELVSALILASFSGQEQRERAIALLGQAEAFLRQESAPQKLAHGAMTLASLV